MNERMTIERNEDRKKKTGHTDRQKERQTDRKTTRKKDRKEGIQADRKKRKIETRQTDRQK